MLGVRTSDHHRLRVPVSEGCEVVSEPADEPLEAGKRLRKLDREARVHDVLRGRSPMQVVPDLVATPL